MKIIPRGRMILVKPDPEESRVSEHGILTPDSVEQERKAVGTVVEVGADIPKVGDKVIYSVFGGETVIDRETKEEYKLLCVSDDEEKNEVKAFLR